MTRASGRKAHSNGADFEKYLEDVIFKAALDSGYFARIDKQNPTYVATRSRAGVTFKPKARSGADWIALGGPQCKWSYIAIEAKSVEGNALPRSAISDEQAAHLEAVTNCGQLAVLVIQFRSGPTSAICAAHWKEERFHRRGNGFSLQEGSLSKWNTITAFHTLEHVIRRWETHENSGWTLP